MSVRNTQNGFSLIGVMIAVTIFGFVSLGLSDFMGRQFQSVKVFEYLFAKTELERGLTRQFLANPNNCKCLLRNSRPFPDRGSASGLKFTRKPTKIESLSFGATNNCSSAVSLTTFIDNSNEGVNGLQSTSIDVNSIKKVSDNLYQGELAIDVRSTKIPGAARQSNIKIPISLTTQPDTGKKVKVTGCSFDSPTSSTPGGINFSALDSNPVWQQTNLPTTGGTGYSKGSGAGRVSLNKVGDYGCGPIRILTIANSKVKKSTSAVILSVFSETTTGREHYYRIFNSKSHLIASIGSANRKGDGKQYGTGGGSVVVPLKNKRFRVQACHRNGQVAAFKYSVQAVID